MRVRARRRGERGAELRGLFVLKWSERGSDWECVVVERMDRGVLMLFGWCLNGVCPWEGYWYLVVLGARNSLEETYSRAEVVGQEQAVLGGSGRRLQTGQACPVVEVLRTAFEMVEVAYCGLDYALKLYGMARSDQCRGLRMSRCLCASQAFRFLAGAWVETCCESSQEVLTALGRHDWRGSSAQDLWLRRKCFLRACRPSQLSRPAFVLVCPLR